MDKRIPNRSVVYVDDEPIQHSLLKKVLGAMTDLEIHCFESPADALERLSSINPEIIICNNYSSDFSSLSFLDTARKICADSLLIVSVGFGEESKLFQRNSLSNIYEVITKPWDKERFVRTIGKAIVFYDAEVSRRSLSVDLEKRNLELERALNESKNLLDKYEKIESEIKCWVHPFALNAVREFYKFPQKRDLALLVFDIINSSNIHEKEVLGTQLRTKVLQVFWEIVLKHAGEVESYEGDKGYATFGLNGNLSNPSNAAFAASKEFRSAIEAINDHFGYNVEVGVAIHYAKNCVINLRQVAINTDEGILVRKWFDTSSLDVDFCHRLEGLAHQLPGSNILLSGDILERVTANKDNIVDLGGVILKGQNDARPAYLNPSSKCKESDISLLLSKNIFSSKRAA